MNCKPSHRIYPLSIFTRIDPTGRRNLCPSFAKMKDLVLLPDIIEIYNRQFNTLFNNEKYLYVVIREIVYFDNLVKNINFAKNKYVHLLHQWILYIHVYCHLLSASFLCEKMVLVVTW